MNELNKDQWLKSMSTGFGDPDHPINGDVKDEVGKLKVQVENAEMAMSDVTKLIKYSEALQKMFNPSEDLEDWVEAKLNHACDYVATVRDYLKFYRDEKEAGTPEDQINEKWSKKQKQGINCSNPKGFSQRAHCAGRRARQAGKRTKSSSVSEVELYNDVLKNLVAELIEDIGNSNMAMGALKQINNDAKELQSMLKPETQLEDWVKAKLNLAGEYLDDVYHHLDHFGSEGRKFDENINELDYEGAVGFHELMTFYGKASDEQRQKMDDCLADKNVECVKDLIHQVTGMTLHNITENDLSSPEFYKKRDQRLRYASRPVIRDIAYWISPSGDLIMVGDHKQWVNDNSDKIMGFNAKEPYTSAFRKGYVRLKYLPNDSTIYLQNSGEDKSYGFHVDGNESTGTPPVTPKTKNTIRKFIKEKEVLVVVDDRGIIRIDEIMNESWGTTLSTAALAAAMLGGTANVDAATKGKSPVTAIKKQGSKIYVNVDEIKTSTPSQKYTLKNEGAVRNYYLIGDKPHIGGGHHLDGSAGSRNNIRRIASMPNDNPKTNEQLIRYVEGGPATAQTFSEVLLSNDQISMLFKYDYEEKVEIAKKKYKNFNKFPALVQTMLVDSIFRGEKHPKTDELVNSPNPDWNQVAAVYLNDKEYRSSKDTGSGVFVRMERNAELLKRADSSIASISKTKNEAI